MSKEKFPQALHDFAKSNGGSHGTPNHEPSLTRQEFAEECDINSLMARYEGHVTGGPGNMRAAEPMYIDMVNIPQDLMGYLDFMKEAERSFMSLPARVRKEFDNDPHQFVEYATDPSSLEQMREWGLAPPAKAPEPAPGPSVAAPSSSPPSGEKPAEGGSTHGST